MLLILLLSCGDDDTVAASEDPRVEDLQERLDALEAQVADLEGTTGGAETHDRYTDEEALAAVQNLDPWADPEATNITDLWSYGPRGHQWLTDNRWTMDNRTDPAGATPRHELVQMFHESPECLETSTFEDCNSTAALKFYVNGPRITDNDWSADGYAAAAVRRYHTHASGIYLVSFGQLGYVTDYAYGLIPPSGIHLEPHGAHQALRIDGTANSGENVRIDTTLGSKGIAIYESPAAGSYCEELGGDCTESYPLYLRGGRVHLEDLTFARSATDTRNAGVWTLHETSLGVEHFYTWHTDSETGQPVHCTWNTTVTADSLVRVQAYTTSPDLQHSHSYVLVDVWGPGDAPGACTAAQDIKTDAAGVYGSNLPKGYETEGGFSVAILGPSSSPLWPGDWQEGDRPSFLYEVLEAL